MAFKFLIFAILASAIFCHKGKGDLVTYQTVDGLRDEMVQEIKYITSEFWNITKEHDFGNVQSQSTCNFGLRTDTLKLTDFVIKHVETNLTDISASVNAGENSFTTTIEAVNGSSIFKLVMGFKYEYSCYYVGKGEGEVKIRTSSSSLNKIFSYGPISPDEDRFINFTTADIKSEFTIIESFKLLIGDYLDDTHVQDLAKKAFNDIMKEPQYQSLVRKFDSEFDRYYENRAMRNIDLLIDYPKTRVSLSFVDQRVPIVNPDKGVVFYYNGQIEDKKRLRSLDYFDGSKFQGPMWNGFNKTDGNYQIFFHSELFNDLYEHISVRSQMQFNLKPDQLPADSTFKMDINTLGQIYPRKINFY